MDMTYQNEVSARIDAEKRGYEQLGHKARSIADKMKADYRKKQDTAYQTQLFEQGKIEELIEIGKEVAQLQSVTSIFRALQSHYQNLSMKVDISPVRKLMETRQRYDNEKTALTPLLPKFMEYQAAMAKDVGLAQLVFQKDLFILGSIPDRLLALERMAGELRDLGDLQDWKEKYGIGNPMPQKKKGKKPA